MKNQKGYFLLEATVLIAVLLAAASAVFVFGMAKAQSVHNEAAVAAAFLGQEQLAYVEAQPTEILMSANSFDWMGTGSSPVLLNGQSYTVTTGLEADADERFRRVLVTVAWDENNKKVVQTYRKLVKVH